jgi:hypothetical protein
MMKWLVWGLIGIWLLAACAQTPAPQVDAQLPTIAQLPSLTATETPAPTNTGTRSPTPTDTLTPSLTPTATVSVTPSVTITDTPTPTGTPTITNTPYQGPLFSLAQAAAHATILPQSVPVVTPDASLLNPTASLAAPLSPTCFDQPPGGFGTLYYNNTSLSAQIGCLQAGVTTVNSAMQSFERGTMLWLDGPIYVLYADGRYQQYSDTFDPNVDPERGGETPPSGLVEPIRGFGKVWRVNPDVRNGLGWGTTSESGGTAVIQRFDRGWMFDLTQRT